MHEADKNLDVSEREFCFLNKVDKTTYINDVTSELNIRTLKWTRICSQIQIKMHLIASDLPDKQNSIIIIIMASTGNKFYIHNGVKMSGKPGEASFTYELPVEQESLLKFLVDKMKKAVLKAIHEDRMKMGQRSNTALWF